MANVRFISTNFSAGELSPQISKGRMDVAKWNNGVATMENCLISVQGGAQRRPGTRYIATTKNASKISRLVRFVYSKAQSYVVELGDIHARFLMNRAYIEASPGVPYEIVSPYTEARLREIDYSQKSDTCFLTHSEVYPQRLQRFQDNRWNLINTPFITEPFEEIGDYPTGTLTLSALTGSGITATSSSSYFLTADVGRTITYNGGVATITNTTAGNATLTILSAFPQLVLPSLGWLVSGSPLTNLTSSVASPAGSSTTLTASVGALRSGDVGKYIVINGGLIQLTAYTNSTTMTGTILQSLTSTVPAPAYSWSMETGAWNATFGYPRAVSISKQRLFYAGSPKYPLNIWGSQIQGYLNFQFGTKDDDAFRFELDGYTNTPIRHLAPSGQLLVMTEDSEMTIFGGQEKPITPTNIQKEDQSAAGCNYVKPVKAGTEIVFVNSSGLKVNAAGYRYENNSYNSPDRTIFSSHITKTGLVDMAYAKNPDPSILTIRTDGQMPVCAYDIDQEVTGWNRWTTQGSFESVASIPYQDIDDIYVTVKRNINGNDVRYIEVFDRNVYLDCAYVGFDAVAKKTWTGMPWLEGMEVQVRADGKFGGKYTVSGGAVTLNKPANDVQIGLAFTPLIIPNQPAIDGPTGTTQGEQIHINQITVRVLDTSAVAINGNPIDFRKFGDELLDQPVPVVSGDVRFTTLQDQVYLTKCEISQPYPMPFHLLDIIRKITVN